MTVVDNRHGIHRAEERLEVALESQRFEEDGVQVELRVLGGKELAIVPNNVAPKIEGNDQAIAADVPALRQVACDLLRHHIELNQGAQHRLEERVG